MYDYNIQQFYVQEESWQPHVKFTVFLVLHIKLRLSDIFISIPLAIDTYAMAGMALQCVKDSGSHVHNAAELEAALSNIKQKLLASRRADGHIGNEFSTGLAVQVRICFSSLVGFAEWNPPDRLVQLKSHLIYLRRCWQWEAQ